MAGKDPKPVMLAVLGMIALLVVIAFVQNPPQQPEEHNHAEDGQQSQVMSGKLQDIDLSKAKVVKIQPQELADANCANEIAQSLNDLNAVGELTVDLAQKIVTVQYDASKVDENKILEAFTLVKHPATIIPSTGGSTSN